MANGDYSGWAFKELTPGSSASTQTAQSQPDPLIGQHSPEDYATLTSQQAIQRMHDQGLMPDVGKAQDIFTTALARAQDYQKTQAEKLQQLLPTIQTATGKESLVTLEAKERAQVAEQQKQIEAGPGALAIATAQTSAGKPGYVAPLPEADQQMLDTLTRGYNAVNDLGDSFNYMMSGKPKVDKDGHPVTPPPGVGGQWRSLGGRLAWYGDASSQSALNFARQREAAFIPISRAVMGEVGATPAKQQMVELSLEKGLPHVQDDEETGNNQIFNYKKSIMEQLQTLYNNRSGNYDTSKISEAIARYNSDFMSPTTQAWNPIQTSKTVALGSSNVAQNVYDNVNKGALAGMNNPQPAVTPQPQETPIIGMPGQSGASGSW